jgi:hypothetical protein
LISTAFEDPPEDPAADAGAAEDAEEEEGERAEAREAGAGLEPIEPIEPIESIAPGDIADLLDREAPADWCACPTTAGARLCATAGASTALGATPGSAFAVPPTDENPSTAAATANALSTISPRFLGDSVR